MFWVMVSRLSNLPRWHNMQCHTANLRLTRRPKQGQDLNYNFIIARFYICNWIFPCSNAASPRTSSGARCSYPDSIQGGVLVYVILYFRIYNKCIKLWYLRRQRNLVVYTYPIYQVSVYPPVFFLANLYPPKKCSLKKGGTRAQSLIYFLLIICMDSVELQGNILG